MPCTSWLAGALTGSKRIQSILILSATIGLTPCILLAQASPPAFIPLEPLAGYAKCAPLAISADARTVVGRCEVGGPQQAFVWTQEQGMVGLGFLPGATTFSYAAAVSADGSVIVGASNSAPFRYTEARGMESLGFLPGGASGRALGVSGDGRIIVGYSHQSPPSTQGFRWTEKEGMIALGSLPPNPPSTSHAFAISADGSVIVGRSDPTENSQKAFRWRADSGMTQIISNCGANSDGVAYAVSSDGQFVAGKNLWCSFRWSAQGIVDELPIDAPFGMSADGSMIVGFHYYTGGPEYQAVVWTPNCAVRKLIDLLSQTGMPMAGWTLTSASGIAADNRTIVGSGINPEGQTRGFVARLPRTGDANFDGTVDSLDILAIVSHWGPCPAATCAFIDVNCDNVVGPFDLISVIANWG